MNLKESLELFYDNVAVYHSASIDDIDAINEAMKNISVSLVFLTKERVEFNKKWESCVFENSKNETTAKAKTIANKEVPELYELRRVHEAGQLLLKGIISHYSRLKQEL